MLVLLVCVVTPSSALGSLFDIEADYVEKTQKRVEALGNVLIKGEEMELRADYVVYDSESSDIWAYGDCNLKDKKGEITASTIQYNTMRKDAYIENGSIFLYTEPMKIEGSSITRYGEDLYFGEDLRYTPCLGKRPAWSIRASALEIPIEGYGKARHARFQVYDIPVAYFPYLLFPAKLKRQSGLLFSLLGHSTDTGYQFGLPVYLVLGRSADITVTPISLSKRGLLLATEFRYALDYEQKGWVYGEFLHDRLGGEKIEGGVLDERPDNRWYVKAYQTGGELTWDINLVSNPDYFRDIGTLYPEKPEELWVGQQESKTEEIISRIQWLKGKGPFTIGISSQWKQDLTVQDDDNTLQELPRIMARMAQREIPHTPFRCTAELNSVKLYSKGWIQALKDYGDLELSWPVNLYPYLTLRPYIQEIYRDTRFSEKEEFEKALYVEHWQKRGVSLTTTLYSPRFYHDWYHQIVPSVTWGCTTRFGGNYDPNDLADTYPRLLADDNWYKQNDIDISLANYIRDSAGTSRCDFSFKRTYSRLTEEWGLFEATARLTPNQWISIEHMNKFGKNQTDPQDDAFATQEHKTTINLKDPRGDELSISEDYNRVDTLSVLARAKINFIKGFGVWAEAKHDYANKRFEYIREGISYDAQCWGVLLYYDVEPSHDDIPRKTTVGLQVKFLGLGDMKTTYRMDTNR